MEDQNRKGRQSGGFNPAGLLIGLGIGMCFGVSMGNMALGVALGLGSGLCYCVALGRGGGKKDE